MLGSAFWCLRRSAHGPFYRSDQRYRTTHSATFCELALNDCSLAGDGRDDDDAASEVRRHLALTSAAKAIVARYPDLKPLAHRYLVCFSQFDEQSDGIIKLCLNKLRDGGSDQLQDMQLGALKLVRLHPAISRARHISLTHSLGFRSLLSTMKSTSKKWPASSA